MNQDRRQITILEDGLVKVETDQIPATNHLNAERFLQYLATLLGGNTVTQPKA